jgi:hypothetical protein
LGGDAISAVGGVDILDERDLVACCSSLAGDDRGVGEEVFPDLRSVSIARTTEKTFLTYAEPLSTILSLNLLTVAHPVSVPSPERSRVVNTNSIETLDFKAGALQAADVEAERCRCIGTREDVLAHEETPNEILVLPSLSQASDLKEENSIIIKHVMTLSQETSQVSDTNVFSHLQAGNLVVGLSRDVAVVHAENSGLLLCDAGFA